MGIKTLSENINQAISDLKSIKQAIVDKGVEIPTGTPTSEYGNKISKISGGSGGLKLPSTAFGAKWSYLTSSSLKGIAVDENDNIYLAGSTGNLWKISSEGELLWTENSGSVSIDSITYGPDKKIYVGCTNKYVIKYTQDGEQILSFNTGHSSTINSIAVDGFGNIYTCNSDYKVKKFDSSGNLQWTFSGFTRAVYKVLVDSENNVYCVGLEGILKKMDTSGTELWSISFKGACYDMAIDSEDNIYCVPMTDGYLIKVSSAGERIWGKDNIANLDQVNSIIVDSQGYIYFADSGYNLWKVSKDREIIYSRKVMYNNLKYLRLGNSGEIYCYLTGDKTGYNRILLRLEESVDVNKLVSYFGEVGNCEIYENNDSYMLIKAYK